MSACWWIVLLVGAALIAQVVHWRLRDKPQHDVDRLFLASADILCIMDFDGRFLRINPALGRVLRRTDERILAESYHTWVHPHDLDDTRSAFAALVDGCVVERFRNRYQRGDGDYVVLEWQASADASRGRIYASARDMTASLQAEEDAVSLARAKALNAKFVRSCAHDLRAPVRTMASFTEVLLDAAVDEDTSRMRDYAERVHNSARQLDRMIVELKAFASATNGNGKVETWPVSEVISTVLDRLASDIERRDAEVRVTIRDCEDRRVPASVARVLQNLLDNALRYSDGTPQVRIDVHTTGERLHVEVTDRGMGFVQADADTIFELFTQLHPHLEHADGGMGMGLAHCREIVEHAGGHITAKSAGPGQGATFAFDLPL